MSSFHFGIVEDIFDPKELGRVRVRIFGYHSHDTVMIPTKALPWATVMQPTTSAANSGIGHTPRILNGSLVMVIFTDPDEMQFPVVVGTIPSELKEHIATINGQTVARKTPQIGFQDPNKILPLAEYVGLNDLPKLARKNKFETNVTASDSDYTSSTNQSSTTTNKKGVGYYASELTISDAAIEELKKSEGFLPNPYWAGDGVWTIGYGSTYQPDGSKVTKDTPPIDKQTATLWLKTKVVKVFEPSVKKAVKVKITQSMFDALVDLAYNVGGGGVSVFVRESSLNVGAYQACADYFSNFRVLPGSKFEQGLRNRRRKEREWFLKDGIPEDGQDSGKVYPEQSFSKPETKTTTTSAQEIENEFSRQQLKLSNSLFNFEEPTDIRKNHKYPYNQVRQSLAGHYEEWDDTLGNERINRQHMSGTFQEWRPDGTSVVKIFKDNYTLIADNDNIFVGGNVNVHINGNSNLFIQGNHTEHINGNFYQQVDGDKTVLVKGNCKVQTFGEKEELVVGGRTTNVSGYVFDTLGGWNVSVGGEIDIDGSVVNINSGTSQAVSQTQLTPLQHAEYKYEIVKPLIDISGRYAAHDEPDSITDTPSGYPPDTPAGTNVKEEVPNENNVKPKATSCDMIGDDVDYTLQLSDNFTLASFSTKAFFANNIIAQKGLTTAQIACNLKNLAVNCAEPIRAKYPGFSINSGFRKGEGQSQHGSGQAMDIQWLSNPISNQEYLNRAKWIVENIAFDQFIFEHGNKIWLHISFNTSGNRKKILTMVDGKYIPGLKLFY